MGKPRKRLRNARNIVFYDGLSILKIAQPYMKLTLVYIFYCAIIMCVILVDFFQNTERLDLQFERICEQMIMHFIFSLILPFSCLLKNLMPWRSWAWIILLQFYLADNSDKVDSGEFWDQEQQNQTFCLSGLVHYETF